MRGMNGAIMFRNGSEKGFVAELELPDGTRTSDVPHATAEQHAGGVRTHEATVTGRR